MSNDMVLGILVGIFIHHAWITIRRHLFKGDKDNQDNKVE